jgi:glucose-1-phosphate thymidylyltransferase
VILREGKWDIPAYFNDGTALLDMHLAYLMMRQPFGSPFTLDQAYPFARERSSPSVSRHCFLASSCV